MRDGCERCNPGRGARRLDHYASREAIQFRLRPQILRGTTSMLKLRTRYSSAKKALLENVEARMSTRHGRKF